MKKLHSIWLIVGLLLLLFVSFSNGQTSRRDTYWAQPEKVMDVVGVTEGMVIGEAGAGEGYLTFYLSKRVWPTGKIYASDIDDNALETVKRRYQREGINNITTVIGDIADPLFPDQKLDMIIMLRAFHDFENQEEWLVNAKKYMKPEAPLVIIDGHDKHTRLNKEKVLKMADDAGFELTQYETFLPSDFIYVFKLKQ